MTPSQVTDSYLLALAVKNRSQLATSIGVYRQGRLVAAMLACMLSVRSALAI